MSPKLARTNPVNDINVHQIYEAFVRADPLHHLSVWLEQSRDACRVRVMPQYCQPWDRGWEFVFHGFTEDLPSSFDSEPPMAVEVLARVDLELDGYIAQLLDPSNLENLCARRFRNPDREYLAGLSGRIKDFQANS